MGDGRSRRGSGVLSLHRSSPLISEDDCVLFFVFFWLFIFLVVGSRIRLPAHPIYSAGSTSYITCLGKPVRAYARDSECFRVQCSNICLSFFLFFFFLFVFLSITVRAAMLFDFKLFLEETFE